jgi:hypothetical protein
MWNVEPFAARRKFGIREVIQNRIMTSFSNSAAQIDGNSFRAAEYRRIHEMRDLYH